MNLNFLMVIFLAQQAWKASTTITLGNTQGNNDPTLPHNPGGVELQSHLTFNGKCIRGHRPRITRPRITVHRPRITRPRITNLRRPAPAIGQIYPPSRPLRIPWRALRETITDHPAPH